MSLTIFTSPVKEVRECSSKGSDHVGTFSSTYFVDSIQVINLGTTAVMHFYVHVYMHFYGHKHIYALLQWCCNGVFDLIFMSYIGHICCSMLQWCL